MPRVGDHFRLSFFRWSSTRLCWPSCRINLIYDCVKTAKKPKHAAFQPTHPQNIRVSLLHVCVCVCGEWEGLGVRVRNRCLYLLSLLEPSSGDRVALLVLQQLLRCLEELVAHVALEHSRDEVDLQVPLVHAARLAHKIAEDALESWGGQTGGRGECEAAGGPRIPHHFRARTHNCLKRRFPNDMNFQSLITPPLERSESSLCLLGLSQ